MTEINLALVGGIFTVALGLAAGFAIRRALKAAIIVFAALDERWRK